MERKSQLVSLEIEESDLRHKGDYEGALETLDRMLAIDDSYSPALNNKGAILLMYQRYEQALPYLEQAISSDPSNGQALNNCAFCYHAIGHPEKAVPLYYRAMERGYTHEGVNYNLGLALIALGRINEAIEQLKTAVQKNPSYTAPLKKLSELESAMADSSSKEPPSYKTILTEVYLALYEQVAGKSIDPKVLHGPNRDLEKRLDLLLEASGKAPQVLTGTFPVRTFNAQVVKVESGFLLLVHENLMLFALQTSALLAGLVEAESKGSKVPLDIGLTKARQIFIEWVLALVNGKPKERLDYYPNGPRLNFTQFLFSSLVDFVIAHELSHILQGHFDEREVTKVNKTTKQINYYFLSWQQEFEADLVAIDLVKKIAPSTVSEESMYAGPALFFEIVDAIPEIVPDKRIAGLSSHPPAASRRAAIITNTHSEGFHVRAPRLDYLVETMAELRRSYA